MNASEEEEESKINLTANLNSFALFNGLLACLSFQRVAYFKVSVVCLSSWYYVVIFSTLALQICRPERFKLSSFALSKLLRTNVPLTNEQFLLLLKLEIVPIDIQNYL